MAGPDLILINPGNRKGSYQGLGDTLAAVENPIWAGLLASFVRRSGYGVEILDANAEELTPAAAAQRVVEANPRLACVVVYGHNPSASTMVMPAAGALVEELKGRGGPPVLMLGGHVAALPERTLLEEKPDYVCAGEGFHTLTALLEHLRAGGGPGLERVPDLFHPVGGGIVRNAAAPLVRDLDGLVPGHSFDLLPMERYRCHNWHAFGHIEERRPYAAIYTTLGCPFRCEYCCIQAPFKRGEKALGYGRKVNTYRRWSPAKVLAEIGMLVEDRGLYNLKIADEMFALNRSHVLGICDGIAQRGWDLNIWAYARVDTVDREFLERMRRGGVRWLCLGIEAANARVRDDVQKGYTPDDLARTMKEIKEVGIHVIANYLFGLPEDDLDTMGETLALAREFNCEFANFYCAMAYPGSRLYERALAKGWDLPPSWEGYSQLAYHTRPLPTNHCTPEEVLRFRDRAFQDYFTDPAYLAMVRRTFGEATERHVREMTARPLPRAAGERTRRPEPVGKGR